MKNVNTWRQIRLLPVIRNENRQWNIAELQQVLFKAIRLCGEKCIEDNKGRIFTTLSGGLDSSLCLAVLRQILPSETEIHTFTIGGSKNHADIKAAQRVSRRFKTIHHELIPGCEYIEFRYIEELKKLGLDEKEDMGVFWLYRFISSFQVRSVIVHDGIDELLGGYWEHRGPRKEPEKEKAFQHLWKRLAPDHLISLEKIATRFNISLIFPYLQKEVVEFISQIPVNDRTSHRKSKMPLRRIANGYLPSQIINRKKKGFNEALCKH